MKRHSDVAMMRSPRKMGRLVAGLVACPLALVGMSSAAHASSSVTNINMWEGDTGPAATALKAQVAGYNASAYGKTCHAGTTFIAATGHEFTPKLLTALSSGSGPNLVLSYSEPQDMAEVAATGHLITLNSYMSKDGRPVSYFYPAMMKASTFGGKVYSFPTDGGDYAILYNKKIFKEAGIAGTPTTWAQVAADSAKIASSVKGVYGFYVPFGVNEWTVWTFESMLWSEGGHFLNANNTKAQFGSAAGVAGLNVWVNLLKKHLAYPSSLSNSAQNAGYPGFQDGKVAMYIDGSYDLGIDDKALGAGNVGVFQFPKTKQFAMNTGTNQSFMLKGTPAQETCEWDYLKYMTEPSVQANWDVATGFIPTVKAVAQTPTYKAFVAKDPRLKVFVQELNYAHTRPSIQNYAQISAELGTEIEAALMQQKSAQSALSAAQAQANQILASSAG